MYMYILERARFESSDQIAEVMDFKCSVHVESYSPRAPGPFACNVVSRVWCIHVHDRIVGIFFAGANFHWRESAKITCENFPRMRMHVCSAAVAPIIINRE